jgi:hypothetical protein
MTGYHSKRFVEREPKRSYIWMKTVVPCDADKISVRFYNCGARHLRRRIVKGREKFVGVLLHPAPENEFDVAERKVAPLFRGCLK